MLKIFNALLVAANTGGGLPAGYTQVEYVKNTENTTTSSCIPTGIYTDVDDFEFEMKVKVGTGAWNMLCTAATGIGIRGASSYNTLIGAAPGGTVSWRSGRGNGTLLLIKFNYKNGNAYMEATNLSTSEIKSDTATYTYTEDNKELKLFFQVYSGQEVYYVKIKKSGVLVANYIPALDSNNVAGFYDMTSKSFKTAQDTSIYTGIIEE